MSGPTWNYDFEVPGGSYLTSDFQYYFEYILRKQNKISIILQ